MQGRWAMEAAAGPPDSMHESAKASPSSGFISWTTDSQQPETRHLKSHVRRFYDVLCDFPVGLRPEQQPVVVESMLISSLRK